jgi:hypothetical protein
VPIAYGAIKKQVALRSAQLSGTSQSTLEAAYNAFTVDGAEVPTTAMKDLILMIEKELAQQVGDNVQSPARKFLSARTVNLSDLDVIPSVDENGVEIVGVWDSVAEAVSNRPLTWQPTQTITDIVDGAPGFFGNNYYYYNINGEYIRTTRPTIYLQGCSWSLSVQSAAYDSNGNSPLPEYLANTWIAGVISNLPQVGWTDSAGVAGMYNGIYERGLQQMAIGSSGSSDIPLSSRNVISG